MPPCNCGGRNVAYEVKFKTGARQTYGTLAEAQSAIRAAGGKQGTTIKAVKKAA